MIKALTLASAAMLLAAAALATPVTAQPGAQASPGIAQADSAKGYVAAAGASDLFEIQSSQLALQKATTPDIKAFAQMMVDHHTKTTADLMAAAKQAGLEPGPPRLSDDKAGQLAALKNASGKSFDGAYMRGQVAGHEEALALHEAYADKGDQPALKAAAGKTAPIVRTHLERARALRAS